MSTYPFLKSPAFLCGSGMFGSGIIGIGGWQIYEDVKPTAHRKFSKLGYKWDPIALPDEKKVKDVRWTWNSWGCVNRLFPKVSFKHEDTSAQNNIDSSSYDSIYNDNSTLEKETNPIGCAIMDLQPVKHEEKTHFYFKSEFVIKGQNVGWVLWTGLSKVPEKEKDDANGGYKEKLNFVYRLIFLKKKEDEDIWEIKEGYYWGNNTSMTPTNQKYFVKSPDRFWFNARSHTDISTFSGERWSGIWEVENGADNGFLKGVEVYIDKSEDAEILGADGEFSVTNNPGFTGVNIVYDVDRGWVSFSERGRFLSIENRLIRWYSPFKGLKGKWTNLYSRCKSLSYSRDLTFSGLEDLKDLCWYLQK